MSHAIEPYEKPDAVRLGPTRLARFAPFITSIGVMLLLACAVPLAGAVLLIAFADERMTLGFRLLVATLIGVGVAGVGIAERVTRRLRELAAIWRHNAGNP